jgi:hypothetical protein
VAANVVNKLNVICNETANNKKISLNFITILDLNAKIISIQSHSSRFKLIDENRKIVLIELFFRNKDGYYSVLR